MQKVLDRKQKQAGDQPERDKLPGELSAQVDRLADERHKLLDLAEQVLMAAHLPDDIRGFNARGNFSTAELTIFDALAWDNNRLAMEACRVIGIRRWQAQAGDSARRAATIAQLKSAQAALADRGPKLQAEIAKLRRELADLEQQAEAAQSAERAQEVALEQLRKLPSPLVKERHEAALTALAPLRARVAELSGQLNSFSELLALDVEREPAARQRATLHAQSACPEIAGDMLASNPAPHTTRWRAYCESIEQQLPALEQELAETQEQLEQRMQAAAALLDCYAR